MTVARFGECADCHRDAHLGQLARAVGGTGCDSCHSVEGFFPVLYPTERHQGSDFPLDGAHLAVPCNSCHQRVEVATLADQWSAWVPRRGISDSAEVTQFRFASQACVDCHVDPHLEESRHPPEDQSECTDCHDVDSWRLVSFDHRTTEFPLVGRHAKVACRDCHSLAGAIGEPQSVRFEESPLTCSGCHKDPHAGQLSAVGAQPGCDRCHTADGWHETLFVHNRDSSYRLEGAHSRVPCGSCHREREVDGTSFVQYKSIPTACEACHASGVAELKSREG